MAAHMWYFPRAALGRAQLPFGQLHYDPVVLFCSGRIQLINKNEFMRLCSSIHAKILCKKKKRTYYCTTGYTYRTLTPSHRYLCSSQNGSMWYWYGTYSAATGFHQYCIVNVKDSYTYPYIFSSKSFDPVTVPLKWDSVELLHGDAVFPKMRLMVVMLTWFMLLNTCLSASIFCRSWWRRMALSALTRSTTASSCCGEQALASSPRRSSSHLENTTTYCHRFAYFSYSTLLYILYHPLYNTVLQYKNHGMFHKTTTLAAKEH